jgi:hypothetical protein
LEAMVAVGGGFLGVVLQKEALRIWLVWSDKGTAAD